jgi:hypothetical protein
VKNGRLTWCERLLDVIEDGEEMAF